MTPRPWPPEHPGPLDYAEAAVFAGPLALLAAFWQTARWLARVEGAARQAWEAR